MNKDEALQLALEAMEEIIHWYAVRDRNDVFLNFVDQNPEIQKIMKSITAIKETLETKDKPMAWEQFHEHMAGPNYVAPQRTWVGLTDEEFNDAINDKLTPECIAIAIEAKLKERNA